MKFLNPAGLWFLLGVPVLIIIYIIKSPHDDKAVSSTYIWKLSSRFMKKKLPLNRLRKILGFIFQLALIVGAALLAARPVKVTGVQTDYILIFDSSASMRMKNDAGETRFERAVPLAKKYADETAGNNSVSIILAGDEAFSVLSCSSDADEIKLALSGISCGYGGCDLEAAYGLARDITDKSSNSEIILYTDKDFRPEIEGSDSAVLTEEAAQKLKLPEGTTLVNMAAPEAEWNAIIKSFDYTNAEEGFVFTAEVFSESRDAEFSCALMVDGEPADACMVSLKAGEITTLDFEIEVESFENAELVIYPSDGLDADNSYGLFKRDDRIIKILVCGPSPFYILNALKTLDNVEVTERIPEEFDWQNDVYFDLYIFDNYTPRHYPVDGSIIYINCDELPGGVSAGDTATVPATLKKSPDYTGMYFENLILKGTMVDGYRPLALTSDWEKLFTCGGEPVIAYRRQAASCISETVISFDFHSSNLPMMTDFPLILKNLVTMSTPSMIETDRVTVGSPVKINAKFNTTKLSVTDSAEQLTSLNFDKGYSFFTPEKSGLYIVTRVGRYSFQIENTGFFAGIPESEYSAEPLKELPEITLRNEQIPTEDATGDLRTLIALIMLALLLLEWGLYYYEQY